MLKGNRFRIYPNEKQKEMLEKHFGASRFIYNKLLDIRKLFYKKFKILMYKRTLDFYIQILKECHPWLKDVDAHSLQQANNNLDLAFTYFFKKINKFPKMKSKKRNRVSYQTPDCYQLNLSTSKIYLNKIGWVKIKIHRELFDEEFFNKNLNVTFYKGESILKHINNINFLRSLSISRTPTHKYYINMITDNKLDDPISESYTDILGIDMGISTFASLSTGEKIKNPMFYKSSLKKLQCIQRRADKKVIGSKNRKKAVLKLAKLYEKITNQRSDFQHKLSLRLIRENQAIAVETLTIANMQKDSNLAQSIMDSAWYSFIYKLEYKAKWYGKTLIKIGMFDPSSKTCNVCGYKLKDLALNTREWVCPECRTNHDRDINAAINIKKFATVGTTGRAYGSTSIGSRDEVGSFSTFV